MTHAAASQQRGNHVAFLLRELAVVTHVRLLFLVGIETYRTPALSTFARALHLLFEFVRHNIALQLSLGEMADFALKSWWLGVNFIVS
jgi:hypothetical protein